MRQNGPDDGLDQMPDAVGCFFYGIAEALVTPDAFLAHGPERRHGAIDMVVDLHFPPGGIVMYQGDGVGWSDVLTVR